MGDDNTPILVGGGQFTQRTAQQGKLEESLNPMQMLEKAARMAAADTGVAEKLWSKIDTISVVRFTADSSEAGRLPIGQYTNAPRTLAGKLGAKPRREYYTSAGGNTPQFLVNMTAELIANGEVEVALLAGAEDLATMLGALKRGVKLDWGDDPGGEPTHIGETRRGVNDYERAHSLYFPVNTYPLFENGLRGHRKRTVADHMQKVGELFSPFSQLASQNPGSWFPTYRTPEEIATAGEKNRYVGFPYTKYMCAVIEVDQAAAVFMTNVKTARSLGIPESKWVYLHGCADVTDIWHVSERTNYHSSPAIRLMGQKALGMAGKKVGDFDFFDLYSCFPSAVEIACQELGLDEKDPRGLTITGGLPYFGGAGNDYVMHSIVTMMDKVRGKPGSFGLVTANGWFLTKHAAGVYSTTPTKGHWKREAPKSYQSEIDALPRPKVVVEVKGEGKVETYTAVTDRQGKRFGIIVGRDANGDRFLANVNDEALVLRMMSEEMLGRPITVTHNDGKNTATFA